MEEQPSCGRGLAERSALPDKLGDLVAAVADNLEAHLIALDLTDENARTEHDAYVTLAREHRKASDQLKATGRRMAGYRDLPMGRHDLRGMLSPKIAEAFANFARLEQELLTFLQRAVERDQRMLVGMRQAAGTGS
jgi:hypothetical protein